ncbi:MAG: tRNA uridine-5-carboxymethylaminomethyl(34) synthesis GTPase MnmE [Vicinamibacterales bacterium]
MFSSDDTIVAVATPAGHGGVGVVRLSGPAAPDIGKIMASRTRGWPPRRVVRSRIQTPVAAVDALVTFFAGPASYTGEDVVEISTVGNPVVLGAVVERAVELGARVARRGEFTLRAVLRGKMDLAQAEGLQDLVDAVSPAQVRAASDVLDGTLSGEITRLAQELRKIESGLEASLDFPDEDYRFVDPEEVRAVLTRAGADLDRLLGSGERASLVRDGVTVVIAGAPNVGKSSLFNAILGRQRAIVTAKPGTTRDVLTERVVVSGLLVVLTDTAGVRVANDPVEEEGVRRALGAVDASDVLVVVLDGTRDMTAGEGLFLAGLRRPRMVVAVNKCDVPGAGGVPLLDQDVATPVVRVSAKTGQGVDDLLAEVVELAVATTGREDVVVTKERQRGLLRSAREHLSRALGHLEHLGARAPEELLAEDVRAALGSLADVVGLRSRDEMLESIFSQFCIGK